MLTRIHRELGIPRAYADDTGIPTYVEPDNLVSIGVDIFGRPQELAQEAADEWEYMQIAAAGDNVSLYVVSAFRSFDYQASLIREKLRKGQSIDDVLRVNTAPGHSEHHSGRALDLTTLDCEPLCQEFKGTAAFQWLAENAAKYSFTMSYPKENRWGIDYEPWHWCYGRA